MRGECVQRALSARLPLGCLYQSPAVWTSRTVLCFPLLLVAEFPGAAVTEVLGTGTCCGISHLVIIRMGPEMSLGFSSGLQEGRGWWAVQCPVYPVQISLWISCFGHREE